MRETSRIQNGVRHVGHGARPRSQLSVGSSASSWRCANQRAMQSPHHMGRQKQCPQRSLSPASLSPSPSPPPGPSRGPSTAPIGPNAPTPPGTSPISCCARALAAATRAAASAARAALSEEPKSCASTQRRTSFTSGSAPQPKHASISCDGLRRCHVIKVAVLAIHKN